MMFHYYIEQIIWKRVMASTEEHYSHTRSGSAVRIHAASNSRHHYTDVKTAKCGYVAMVSLGRTVDI